MLSCKNKSIKYFFKPIKYTCRTGGIVAQRGFSIYFSGYLCITSSRIRGLKILKNLLLTLRSVFQKKAQEWLLLSSDFFPICTQLRKCAENDIVPILKELKKDGSELKFFVSIFRKLNQMNIENREKRQPSKIVTFFLTNISQTYRTIKSPCRAAIN